MAQSTKTVTIITGGGTVIVDAGMLNLHTN